MIEIRTRSRLRDTTQTGERMTARHIRIDDDTWGRLDDLAARLDTTRGELIRWAIDCLLRKKHMYDTPTLHAHEHDVSTT